MNNKTTNWRKIIKYIIVSIFIMYIIAAINFSSESAKQVASNYERRKHKAIWDMELQNYDDLVINKELIDYSMIRDRYNIKWYEKMGPKDGIKGMNHGMGWGRTYSLFNWALLNARVHPSLNIAFPLRARISARSKPRGRTCSGRAALHPPV